MLQSILETGFALMRNLNSFLSDCFGGIAMVRTGAGSPIIGEAVDRIYGAFAEQESADLYASSISKSFVLSVDQAHAIHPNYR